ncbi:hypothetical protein [Rhodococcus opacus]|uniref:hypothetical protein n=1 Tax=Rhodococcus opacus TaxID=37919 RepID=UPI001C458F40|nr:hypothetical protein [Rhodococcus opacus]MBV6762302.1 hypothetical protein [Rhodococcus opacus]
MTMSNWSQAPCRRNPQLWDRDADPSGAETTHERDARYREAIALCRTCPALQPCRDTVTHIVDPSGILAGELYPAIDRAVSQLTPSSRPSRPFRQSSPSIDEADDAFGRLMSALRTQDRLRRQPAEASSSPTLLGTAASIR